MSSVVVALFGAVVLLAINAFFVAAEFALVKARPVRIDSFVTDGRRGASLTQRIQSNLESYLAACQLGITMASLGLGWIGEPAIAALLEPLFAMFGMSEQALHGLSFILGFMIFSSLHIVVGEQVPKTFAIREPETVSLWVAFPLRAFYLLVYPLNWLLNRISGWILSCFGVAEASHGDVLTGIEIEGLISVSKDHGAIANDQAVMLSNLFAFDQRTVGRVMIPVLDVHMLDCSATPEENRALITKTRHSRFPLVETAGGTPSGIILTKDIYAAMIDGAQDPWSNLLEFTRKVLFVPETLKISSLFDMMRADRMHMAFVVDEYGDFVGLITLEDLLEEIVGEIEDETDDGTSEYAIESTEDGWIAHGLAPLGDMQRETGLTVSEDLNVNTLSGLLMHRLGRMPAKGDTIVEDGLEIEVSAMAEHRVDQVKISRPLDRANASSGGDVVEFIKPIDKIGM